MLACWEFAASRPAVANALLAAAEQRAEDALGPALTGLVDLSERDLPEERSDARGYAERMLFTSGFTAVIACVDDGDDRTFPALVDALDLAGAAPVEFEHHGTLHYTWPTSVLLPRQLTSWDEPGGEGETPLQQIMRMEACIRVAHVFLGACEAFVRLFETEMHRQVSRYVGMEVSGRGPEELNRLRTLALAVVNLTRLERVTPSEEDQAYFSLFEANADIRGKHEMIQHATEILYNVQIAETQDKDTRRQWILSIVVGLLTSLTLISVTADAYDFVRAEESLIEPRTYRILVVGVEFALIVAILAVLVLLAVRSQQRRRARS